MRKKDHSVLLSILATILVVAVLCGVAYGTHILTYKPAPSPAPAEVRAEASPTPEAEPEPTPTPEPVHEHTWQEATCTEPRTCLTCGETEGEPLGHQPTPADYWTPSVCSVCGQELAPPLTPEFELHGLKANVKLGETVDYHTVCGTEAPDTPTLGKATVQRYEICPSAEGIESIPGKTWNLPEKEGFEWRLVSWELVFSDENAQQWGMNIKTAFTDYYAIPEMIPEERAQVDHNGAKHILTADTVWSDENNWYSETITVTYLGTEYECLHVYDGGFEDWNNGSRKFHYTEAVQLPAGYDGYISVLYNAAKGEAGTDWRFIYDIADEETLFFRMD